MSTRERIFSRRGISRLFVRGVALFLSLALAGCAGGLPGSWRDLEKHYTELRHLQARELIPDEFSQFQKTFHALRGARQAGWESFSPVFLWKVARQQRRAVRLLEKRAVRERELLAAQASQLGELNGLYCSEESQLFLPHYSRRLGRIQLKVKEAEYFWARRSPVEVARLLDEIGSLVGRSKEKLRSLRDRYSDRGVQRRWDRWYREAFEWSERHGNAALLVDKLNREVLLVQRGEVVRRYPIDLGWNGLSDKLIQGDGATPEGKYRIAEKKGPEETRYYRALLIDYPNSENRSRFERALKSGAIPVDSRIGGMIELHGEGGRGEDWTDGCIALRNPEMKSLYEVAYEGMPVTVVGRAPGE